MSLRLGKKRRNNDEEELMMVMIGEANAAINASKCQEKMFDAAIAEGKEVPDEVYHQAIADCDYLNPYVESAIEALSKYRARVDEVRKALASDD